MITQEKLKELLEYDPETGLFKWIKSTSNRIRLNEKAGCPDTLGYIVIRINKKLYYAHRLAWIYMKGVLTLNMIDHKDGNKGNNKWDNLREATRQENYRNTPARNKLGVKGVYKMRNKFIATITLNRVSIPLGKFLTLEEARNAFNDVANKYHGEFAHSSIQKSKI